MTTEKEVKNAAKSGQDEAGPLMMQEMYYQKTLRMMRESREEVIDIADNHTSFDEG